VCSGTPPSAPLQRAENNSGGYQGPSIPSQNQTGPRRDPNAMNMDKGRGEDKTCYVCRK